MLIAAKVFFSSFEVAWFCLTLGYCKREMRNSVNKIANEDSSKIDLKNFKVYLKNVAVFTFPHRCPWLMVSQMRVSVKHCHNVCSRFTAFIHFIYITMYLVFYCLLMTSQNMYRFHNFLCLLYREANWYVLLIIWKKITLG